MPTFSGITFALLLALSAGQGGRATAAVKQAATGTEAAATKAPAEHLVRAVKNTARPAEDRARDAARKPAEVLDFFGIQPGMVVADLMCSRGFYTEILSDAVGPDGYVYAHNNAWILNQFAGGPLTERLERMRAENVERSEIELGAKLPGNLDAALLVRFYHDFYWLKTDRAAFNRSVFDALAPGGVFGVLDHHAEAGSGARDVQTLHRVERDLVVREILAAGFVLEAESDLLADPSDTRDWNIFADSSARRDQTDRFVLRFRKPRAAAATGADVVPKKER